MRHRFIALSPIDPDYYNVLFWSYFFCFAEMGFIMMVLSFHFLTALCSCGGVGGGGGVENATFISGNDKAYIWNEQKTLDHVNCNCHLSHFTPVS